jgi:hypothetical protein
LAWCGIAAIMVGLPVLLVATAGIGVPHLDWANPGEVFAALLRPDDGTLLVTLLKAVGWVCWAILVAALAVEVWSWVSKRPAPRLPAIGWSQLLARTLVTAALAVFATAQAGTLSAAPQAHAAPVAAATAGPLPETIVPSAVPDTSSRAAAPAAKENPAAGQLETSHETEYDKVTVRKGDTLSKIAHQELGDATRYPEIFEATKGHKQTTGHRITDPDVIWPGDVVRIPHQVATNETETSSASAPAADPASGQTGAVSVADDPTLNVSSHIQTGSTHTSAEPAGQPTAPQTIHTQQAEPGQAGETPKAQAAPPAEPTPAITSPADPVSSVAAAQTHTQAPVEPVEITAAEIEEANREDDETVVPWWLLGGLAGAGALLAGSGWLWLRKRRRAQQWTRGLGKVPAATAPSVLPVEKTLIAVGRVTGDLVENIDQALRHLACGTTELPPLAGVEADRQHLRVLFDSPPGRPPLELPAPWRGAADRWEADWADFTTVADVDMPAPWPHLSVVGQNSAGAFCLANLETLGVVYVSGDPEMVEDFGRYLAAQLVNMPWASRDVFVDLHGFGEELAELDPDRLRWHPADDQDTIDQIVADAVTTIDALDSPEEPVSLLQARLAQTGGEPWASRVLLVDTPAHNLGTLTSLIASRPEQTATSVILIDPDIPPVGVPFELTTDGRLLVPAYGWDLTAVGLTEPEARAISAFHQTAREADLAGLADEPMPQPTPGDPETTGTWREFTDLAGMILAPQVRAPQPSRSSLLPDVDDKYLTRTANTQEDLSVIAPTLPMELSEQVAAAVSGLDADVAQWHDPDSPRPKLSVLGPIKVRVGQTGKPDWAPVAKRRGFFTELLAYLATRPRGATATEIAEAMSITASSVGKHISNLRHWLGTDPDTGTPYLPPADKTEQAKTRGEGVYVVPKLLTDADLFLKLRARGTAAGADGIEDLAAALNLVTGTPYEGIRAGGGAWLADSRDDAVFTSAIVDVAHTLCTHLTATGQFEQAKAAAEVAHLAAPYDATPFADLLEIAHAQGDQNAVKQLMDDIENQRNQDPDLPPADLTKRIADVLERHDLATAAS